MPKVIDRIRALNLQGIHFQKEPKRFYPKRELAAQVLGYVGTDDQGLSGLERQFNQQLQGKPGKLMISVDARKRWFASVEKEPEAGNSLVLTIDQNIQYIAERELERGDGRDARHRRHGDRGKSAHRRDSGAHQPADFQSEYSQGNPATKR